MNEHWKFKQDAAAGLPASGVYSNLACGHTLHTAVAADPGTQATCFQHGETSVITEVIRPAAYTQDPCGDGVSGRDEITPGGGRTVYQCPTCGGRSNVPARERRRPALAAGIQAQTARLMLSRYRDARPQTAAEWAEHCGALAEGLGMLLAEIDHQAGAR